MSSYRGHKARRGESKRQAKKEIPETKKVRTIVVKAPKVGVYDYTKNFISLGIGCSRPKQEKDHHLRTIEDNSSKHLNEPWADIYRIRSAAIRVAYCSGADDPEVNIDSEISSCREMLENLGKCERFTGEVAHISNMYFEALLDISAAKKEGIKRINTHKFDTAEEYFGLFRFIRWTEGLAASN